MRMIPGWFALAVALVLLSSVPVRAQTWQASSQAEVLAMLAKLQPGDTLILPPGPIGVSLDIRTPRVTLVGRGERGRIVARGAALTQTPGAGAGATTVDRLQITADDVVVENVIVNHNNATGNAVNIEGHRVILRRCTVRNGSGDGIQVSRCNGVLIERCLIHDFINSGDAHGISATVVDGLTIRNCEIYDCSGDCIQIDPGRQPWDNVLVERCWLEGRRDGGTRYEDGIDTKTPSSGRSRLTVRDCYFVRFDRGSIANQAACNIKERVDFVIERSTFVRCEIGLRLRDPSSGTVRNCVFDNCDIAVRLEDNIPNVKIHNNTFGNGIAGTDIQDSAGGGAGGGLDVRNNVHLGSKPAAASDGSNVSVSSSDFVSVASRDYHLTSGSAAIDAGVPIASVGVDFDEAPRPAGSGYDAGAFEFGSAAPGTQPPTASFTATPQTVAAGSPVSLDASASSDPDGAIASYTWDFDDGASLVENDPNASHIYSAGGTFVVRLTVTDDDGLTDSTTVTVQVIESQAPGVQFMALGLRGSVNDPTVTEVDYAGTMLAVIGGAFLDNVGKPVGTGQTTLWVSAIDAGGRAAMRSLVVTQ